MKKAAARVLLFVAGVAVGLLAAAGALAAFGTSPFEAVLGRTGALRGRAAPDATSEELAAYAFEILGYIKEGDYEALSEAVHPEYGLLFSPYATVNLSSDRCFTARQVAEFARDRNKYVWGRYDGKGDPIEMTPQEYFREFVFDRDYTKAAVIGVDTVVKTGNALENLKDVFPGARFVDFYIPGSEQDGDLDWSSLRLCFEEYEGEMRLTAIIHSEWTV